MDKKLFLTRIALLALFSSAIFASDLTRGIALTSGEQDWLNEKEAGPILMNMKYQKNDSIPATNIAKEHQKELTKIGNEWFFMCDEHTIHRTEVTKWVLGLTAILGAVIWAIVFWNRKLSRGISERRNIEKELQSSENRYRSLCNASFEGIIITDNGVIIEANTVLSQLLGYPVSDLIGMEAVEIFAPKVRDDVKAKTQAGYEKTYESVALTKAGIEFPVEIQAKQFIYKNRQVRCAAIRDLSTRYKAMAALRESENKFRAVVTGAHDAIIMIDGHGKVMFWNKAAERIFKYAENEIMGKNPHEKIATPAFFKKFKEVYPYFQQTGKGGAIGRTIELTALKKGGEAFPIELSLSAIQIEGKWCAIGVIRDITKRKKMEAELKRLATTDALTGVDNRRSFMEKAEHEIRRAQRYGNRFAMIMVDIDFFKSINDKYGHQAGDLVLQKMTQTVKSALRESDIFGRIGGEEFSILLMETDRETALLTGERIRSCIEGLHITAEQETIHITVSVGATFFKEGDDISTLSKRSDEALYAAKKNGRNCVVSI